MCDVQEVTYHPASIYIYNIYYLQQFEIVVGIFFVCINEADMVECSYVRTLVGTDC